MKTIDRRSFARGFLSGTVVAAAALTVRSETVQAMPLDERVPGALDDWIAQAQVWVGTGPRRHRGRRVRRCWWSRGRRVCGWRWV